MENIFCLDTVSYAVEKSMKQTSNFIFFRIAKSHRMRSHMMCSIQLLPFCPPACSGYGLNHSFSRFERIWSYTLDVVFITFMPR